MFYLSLYLLSLHGIFAQMNYVTWDLFREKDCLLPISTEDAMGLALGYCTDVDSTLRLTVQKATVVS